MPGEKLVVVGRRPKETAKVSGGRKKLHVDNRSSVEDWGRGGARKEGTHSTGGGQLWKISRKEKERRTDGAIPKEGRLSLISD